MKIIKKTPHKTWKVPTRTDKGVTIYLDYEFNYGGNQPKMVDNFVFEATLKPDSFYRGRSAAGFNFIDADDGHTFTMRIAKTKEFLQAILDGRVTVTKNGYKGQFTFAKQGQNYTIMVAK